jgi:hypothetical protein
MNFREHGFHMPFDKSQKKFILTFEVRVKGTPRISGSFRNILNGRASKTAMRDDGSGGIEQPLLRLRLAFYSGQSLSGGHNL